MKSTKLVSILTALLLLQACGNQSAKKSVTVDPVHATHFRLPCEVKAADPVRLNEVIKTFKDKYAIEIALNSKFDPKHKIEQDVIPKEETNIFLSYLEVALTDLEEYPTEFLTAAGVKTMAYSYNPKYEKSEIAGLALFEEQTVLFAVDRDNCSPMHVEETFHHELFHMYHNVPNPPSFEILDWGLLNEPAFKYSSTKDFDTALNHPEKGFVSNYAKTDEGEDSAETFTAMKIPFYAKKVKEWTASDEVLQKKVDFLKKTLTRTSSSFNTAYWENISLK